jgi:hypothetical protein
MSAEDDRRELQQRIDAGLRSDPGDRSGSRFSEYTDSASDLLDRLTTVAASDGVEGVRAALAEFDRLRASEDLPRLQHALMQFLVHHPAAVSLGLRVPSVEERSPWAVLPAKRSD